MYTSISHPPLATGGIEVIATHMLVDIAQCNIIVAMLVDYVLCYYLTMLLYIEYIELFDCKKGGLPPFFSLLGAHTKCIFPSQIFGPIFFSSSFFCSNFDIS